MFQFRGIYTLQGRQVCQFLFFLSEKGSTLKEKNLHSILSIAMNVCIIMAIVLTVLHCKLFMYLGSTEVSHFEK